MYNHYVTWNFIDGVDKDVAFTEVKEALESLKGKIDEIIDISFNKTLSVSSCEVILLSTFKTEADYKVYATHPLHLEAGAKVQKYFTNRHLVDFE